MDWLKELLGEELYATVLPKIGDKKIAIVSDGTWFPKDKFDAVNNENKQLKETIKTHETQLATLSTQATGNEALQQTIKDLQAANTTASAEMQAKLDKQTYDFALEKALTAAKSKNPKAVGALLDTSKIKLDGDKLLGLDEQLTALKTSDAYLFDVNAGSGGGNPPLDNSTVKNPWEKATFNLTAQGNLLMTNPTLAAQLQAAAGIK